MTTARVEALPQSRPDVVRAPAASAHDQVRLRPRAPTLSILVLTAAAAVPLFTWWRGHSLVWGLDSAFPLSLDEIGKYFHLFGGAYQQVDARKLSFIVPWGLLLEGLRAAGVGWDPGFAQRTLEVGLLAASSLGARALVRLMCPSTSEVAAVLAALFYTFNLFALTTIWTSQALLILHYSCLPLVAYAVLRGLRAGRFAASGLVALVWTLLLAPSYITTPLALTDLLLVGALSVFAMRSWQIRLPRVALSLAQMLLLWAGLNAFWLVPLAVNYKVTFAEGLASIAGTSSADLFRLNSASLPDVLRLGGYWGLHGTAFGSPYFPWAGSDNAWTHATGYIPVALAGVGLAGARTPAEDGSVRRASLAGRAAYAAALILFLFLATGGHPPLGNLKVELFRSTGLINSFRSVYQRFTEYVPILLVPFVALGLDALWSLAVGRGGTVLRSAWRAVLLGVPLVFLASVPLPLWDGALFDASGVFPANRISVPGAWVAAGRSLRSRPSNGGTNALVLPIGPSNVTYLDWDGGRSGYVGIHPLSFLTSTPLLDSAPAGSWVRSQIQVGLTSPSAFCGTVSRLDIGAVAWARDANLRLMQASESFLGANTGVPATVLDAAPCLRRMSTTRDVDVYRVVTPAQGLVSYVDRPEGVAVRASYVLGPDLASITVRRQGHAFLTLHIPFANDWRLGGHPPVAADDRSTTFLVPPSGPLTVVDPTQVHLRQLLVVFFIESAGLLIVGLGPWCVSRTRRLRGGAGHG